MNEDLNDLENDLPEGWIDCKLGDYCEIIGGGTPSTKNPEFWNGNIPWITSADIFGLKDIRPRKCITNQGLNNSVTKLLPMGNLVVVTRVGLGKIALNNFDLCFSQDSQGVIINKDLFYPEYLLYYLSTEIKRFKSESRGTTIEGVTKDKLINISVLVPSIPEQRLIIARVDSLLDHVKKAKESLDKIPRFMKRFQQAVLKKAFSGELTAEWRTQQQDLEPAAELLKRIQEERERRQKQFKKMIKQETESLDSSELPDLPERWVWTQVKNISFLITKGATPTSYGFNYVPKGINFVKVENLLNGRLNKSTLKEFITADTYEFLKRSQLRANDILFSIAGTIGRTALVYQEDLPANINQAIALIRYPYEFIYPHYLRFSLESQIIQQLAIGKMRGVGMNNISLEDVNKIAFPLAPLPEQQEIVRRIESLFKFADGTEKNADDARKHLEIMTQSILARAFRGDLSADFREAVRNWKNLDVEARGRYVFVLPEDEREKILNADEFPMEAASRLLERIREEKAKKELSIKSTRIKGRKQKEKVSPDVGFKDEIFIDSEGKV